VENSNVPLTLRSIDAHTAGEPLRLIVDGWPAPEGRTMLERRAWAFEHQDHLRRALMFEPRGHHDMYGALLTEPEHADSDAGVLFMHNAGFSTMCGHGIIAVTTIAFERGLIGRVDDEAADTRTLVLDAPAGQIRARAALVPREGRTRVTGVSFVNVPSFVLASALPVAIRSRRFVVDVAYGGAFYAIVDAEAAGVPMLSAHLDQVRRARMEIKQAVEQAIKVVNTDEPGQTGIYGTIFTGPAGREDAHLRNVTVFADGEVDRSPCGTGTCAVLAVLDAMQLTSPDAPFVHESLIGTTFSARVVDRIEIAGRPAIVPELSGEAWITGDHTFLVDPDDPLRDGFRL
jgi:proline racemase